MNAALWATVVVAVVGNVVNFLTARHSGMLAFRQLLAQKNIERADERDRVRRDDCRSLLSAARQIRHAKEDEAVVAALTQARQAVAGLELSAPELAPEPLFPTLDAFEQLVRLRSGGAWSDTIAEAEADCDRAVTTLRDAMRQLLEPAIPQVR